MQSHSGEECKWGVRAFVEGLTIDAASQSGEIG